MNKIIEILIDRDNLTEKEAIDILNNVRQQISDINYGPIETEQIIMDELGLEMDYIMDILYD